MSYPEQRSVSHVTSADAETWQALLDGIEDAVLVHDDANILCLLNYPATLLFPKLSIGCSLDELDLPMLSTREIRDTELVELRHDGRRLRARRRTLGPTHHAWYVRDITEETELVAELLAQHSRSDFLVKAGQRLGSSLQRGRTIRSITQLAVPTLGDCGTVVLPARRGLLEWWRCDVPAGTPDRGRAGRRSLQIIPGLADALAGETILVDPGDLPAEATWLLPNTPDQMEAIGTVLLAPLTHDNRTLGVLALSRHKARGAFAAEDLATIDGFTQQAATALTRVAQYSEQTHTATMLQAEFLPPPLPEVPGALLAACFRPAKKPLRIGGDFYEVHLTADGGATFALGDVCGKGVEAAALAGRVRQSLHALRLIEHEPARLLHLVNQALLDQGGNRFTTMVVGSMVAEASGELHLTLGAGGHPSPIVVRANGSVEEIDIPGALVGILPDARFGETSIRLAPGELCVLYSDGITEARGGLNGRELFGSERLRAALQEFAGLPAATLTHRVEQRVEAWLEGRDHDDIAVLVIQAVPVTPESSHQH